MWEWSFSVLLSCASVPGEEIMLLSLWHVVSGRGGKAVIQQHIKAENKRRSHWVTRRCGYFYVNVCCQVAPLTRRIYSYGWISLTFLSGSQPWPPHRSWCAARGLLRVRLTGCHSWCSGETRRSDILLLTIQYTVLTSTTSTYVENGYFQRIDEGSIIVTGRNRDWGAKKLWERKQLFICFSFLAICAGFFFKRSLYTHATICVLLIRYSSG